MIGLFVCLPYCDWPTLLLGFGLHKTALGTTLFFFQVEVMMEGIIKAFKDRISGVGWIDNQTVQAVREKVSKITLLL